MGVTETIFATVAAALIVGLAVLAFKSPAQYRRLANVLVLIAAAAFMGTAAYGIGVDRAVPVLVEFIDVGQRREALSAVRSIRPEFEIALWLFGGTISYLYALTLLPRIMGSEGDTDKGALPKKRR